MNRESLLKLYKSYLSDLDFVNVQPLDYRNAEDNSTLLSSKALLARAAFKCQWEIDFLELYPSLKDKDLTDSILNLGIVQGILIGTNFYSIFKINKDNLLANL